jgi:hypothetical protein
MFELSELGDLIDKHGFISTLILVVLFVIFALFWKFGGSLLTKLFDKKLDSIFKKENSPYEMHEISESDISNHELFTYIDYWCYSKLPTLTFSTEYRSVIFRKYLVVLFKAYKDTTKDFVLNSKYQVSDDAQLKQALLKLINDTVYLYETEMRKLNIPEVVITKMKVKNNDTLNLIIGLIEGVCDSHFYNSNKNLLKMFSVLNIMLSVLENIVNNAEPVCNSINGELKGLSMDGKTEI